MAKVLSQPMLPGMPRNRDLLTDKVRYKRGYTPERKREISDAFKHTSFDVMSNYTFPTSPTITKSLALESNNQELRKQDPKRANVLLGRVQHFRDSVISTVASSSAPVESVKGVNRIVGNVDMPGNDVGRYYPVKKNLHLITDKVTKNESIKRTLMHELGHHYNNSALDMDNPDFRTDDARGQREAVADNFAEHYPSKGQKIGANYLRTIDRDQRNADAAQNAGIEVDENNQTYSNKFVQSYVKTVSPKVVANTRKNKRNPVKKYKGPTVNQPELPLESGHDKLHRSLSD